MILKILQILGLQPQISKVFLDHKNIFITVGQNNFCNKIPLLPNVYFITEFLCLALFSSKILTNFENNSAGPVIVENICVNSTSTYVSGLILKYKFLNHAVVCYVEENVFPFKFSPISPIFPISLFLNIFFCLFLP